MSLSGEETLSCLDVSSSDAPTPVNEQEEEDFADISEISASRLLAHRAPWATPPKAAVESVSLFSPTQLHFAGQQGPFSPPDSLLRGLPGGGGGAASVNKWDSARLDRDKKRKLLGLTLFIATQDRHSHHAYGDEILNGVTPAG